jgi:hypothetical protein
MEATTTDGGLLKLTTKRGAVLHVRRVRNSERQTLDALAARIAGGEGNAAKMKGAELVVRAAVVNVENLPGDDGKPVEMRAFADPLFPEAGRIASPAVFDAMDTQETVDVYTLAIAGLAAAQVKN